MLMLHKIDRRTRLFYYGCATRHDRMQQYFTKLVALGRIDEVMSATKIQMDTAEIAFTTAIPSPKV
ncbi:hypothetical protein NIES4101_28390 [Calothrix sp. NIES-4101]|nr:hypothetical protein NIES4101_28390 [Calothrix sp. NIES-4101]